MIFRELSNAVYCFVLRCAGVEIDGGGCSNTPPPPQQVVENPGAQQGENGHWGPVILNKATHTHKVKIKYITVFTLVNVHISTYVLSVASAKLLSEKPVSHLLLEDM